MVVQFWIIYAKDPPHSLINILFSPKYPLQVKIKLKENKIKKDPIEGL